MTSPVHVVRCAWHLTGTALHTCTAPGDPNVGYNPGAGSQCEGEDWTSEVQLFDVATTHMYYRYTPTCLTLQ